MNPLFSSLIKYPGVVNYSLLRLSLTRQNFGFDKAKKIVVIYWMVKAILYDSKI